MIQENLPATSLTCIVGVTLAGGVLERDGLKDLGVSDLVSEESSFTLSVTLAAIFAGESFVTRCGLSFTDVLAWEI